ncbi:MAG TPA: hypothetical protein VKB93_04935 [Thermoanaerobaculia bacterium]|nr:hypothetical protein [Thermoanaerobaculia bacterium]
MQNIVPAGTQVVSSSEVRIRETGKTLPDPLHAYRVRFVEDSEASLHREQFQILHAVRNSGIGEAEKIEWRNFVIFRCIVGSRAFGLETGCCSSATATCSSRCSPARPEDDAGA